jgi:hypothetical protein
MAQNTARHPDFPTCAECLEMGVYIPPMLARIECDVGHRALVAFLQRWGGQEVSIPKSAPDPDKPFAEVLDWLRSDLGFGRWNVPLGIVAARTLVRWQMLARLRAGQSLAQVAHATQCSTRSVSQRKTDFTRRGLLPAPAKALTKETPR